MKKGELPLKTPRPAPVDRVIVRKDRRAFYCRVTVQGQRVLRSTGKITRAAAEEFLRLMKRHVARTGAAPTMGNLSNS